jgi:hypothetical protein
MKTVKTRSPMGGTGKVNVCTATCQPSEEFLIRMKKRIVEVKWHIAACIDDHTDTADTADQVAVSVALLEMAVDRFIEKHGQKDALEMIDTALGRFGLKLTSPLQ